MSNEVSRWTADGSDAPDDMRDLLRSGKLDDPSEPQVDALWAKLQPIVGPGGGEGSGPDGAEGPDAPAPVPSASVAGAGASAAGAGAATWVRPLVTALIAGAAISTSAVWVGEQNPHVERKRSEVSETVPSSVAPTVPREVDPNDRADSPPAQRDPEVSPPVLRDRARAPRGTGTKPDAAVEAPVESEAEYLQRAHAALRSGLASQALSMANDHARLYPRGVLSQEREIILVQALVHLGRRQDAIARTESFLRQYPNSAHARRLRTVLGLAEPTETDPATKSPDEVIMSDGGVHSQPERFETGGSKP